MRNEAELYSLILHYNTLYRQGTPEISDAEFDNLLEEYKSLVTDELNRPNLYVELREKLFSQKGKIKHPFIMGSLEKIKAEEENSAVEWAEKHPSSKYLVMAKIDGISCRLKYEYGHLVEAATRGDGEAGEDILYKMKLIMNIPCYINALKHVKDCNIRGELVITKSAFDVLNEASAGKFKNSRNATAGIINRKHDVEYTKYISFFAYEIMGSAENRHSQLKILKSYALDTVEYITCDVLSNSELLEYYNTLTNDGVQYDIDGLVLCPNEYCGENTKIPDNMIAFKANLLKGQSTVIDVDWGTPSKDGKLVPVISISPVDLGGSMIQRVTAYNAEWLKTSKLKYGSDVVIMKSGDVIPKIVEILPEENSSTKKLIEIEWPEVCPICDTPTQAVGVDCVCPNKNCIGRLQEQAFQFIRKLGIKNIAKKTLINNNLNSIADIINTDNHTSNLPSIKKFYKDLTSKLYSSDISKLLSCCNFTGISDTLFFKIWEIVEDAIPVTPDATAFDINIITDKLYSNLPKGIGMASASSFIESLEDNFKLILPIITSPNYNPIQLVKSKRTEYVGSVCFTGSLNTMSRNEASEIAERAGYKVASGVSSKLTYLVTNDKYSNSSKNKKARELNIPVISEEEFLNLVKGKDITVESSIDLL